MLGPGLCRAVSGSALRLAACRSSSSARTVLTQLQPQTRARAKNSAISELLQEILDARQPFERRLIPFQSEVELPKQATRKQVVIAMAATQHTEVAANLGFIGAGQMAEAMARGFDRAGVLKTAKMSTTDISASRLDVFTSFGVSTYRSALEVAQKSDVIILSVKPNIVRSVLKELQEGGALGKEKLVVSIAAGVTVDALQQSAGEGVRVIRVMPNTPCLVGQTAAAMALGKHATPEDAELVKALFGAVGQIFVVDEKLLDAVTGLSGSGPAYVFIAIEALADGGVAAGLPRDVALALASQTVAGAAQMVIQTNRHPGDLKDSVASPGGTTIAGLHELEKAGFRASLMNAVLAATKRSKELSK